MTECPHTHANPDRPAGNLYGPCFHRYCPLCGTRLRIPAWSFRSWLKDGVAYYGAARITSAKQIWQRLKSATIPLSKALPRRTIGSKVEYLHKGSTTHAKSEANPGQRQRSSGVRDGRAESNGASQDDRHTFSGILPAPQLLPSTF